MNKITASLFTGLLLTLIVISCTKKENLSLELLDKYKLDVPEPSDLAFSADSKSLWTVSDEDTTVYLITLKGEIIKKFKIDGFDLEGITTVSDSTICVVLERDRELIFLNNDGNELNRVKLDLAGEDNSGLEGITYHSKSGHFYLVNEKNPGLLIELDDKLFIIKKKSLTFGKDFSGIFWEETEDVIWIISDESQLVAKCNFDGDVIEQFKVDIPQIEGIAVDQENNRLYLVSDNDEHLYVYEIN